MNSNFPEKKPIPKYNVYYFHCVFLRNKNGFYFSKIYNENNKHYIWGSVLSLGNLNSKIIKSEANYMSNPVNYFFEENQNIINGKIVNLNPNSNFHHKPNVFSFQINLLKGIEEGTKIIFSHKNFQYYDNFKIMGNGTTFFDSEYRDSDSTYGVNLASNVVALQGTYVHSSESENSEQPDLTLPLISSGNVRTIISSVPRILRVVLTGILFIFVSFFSHFSL